MATSRTLEILITAKNEASKKFDEMEEKLAPFKKSLQTVAVLGTAAFAGVGVGVKSAIEASNKMESALVGLTTVAGAFNESADDAKNAAIALSSDGLLSVSEAAEGLKNLIPKLGLKRAIELMDGFKDTAAFNRQGTLGFGEAIVGATSGIKNMNSILVDNAGVTKNLSIIMGEAGFEMQDLDDKTKGAAASTALYDGLLKEMAIFQGDAEKATETLAGQQAKLSTQIFNTKAAIGEALAPVLADLIEKITPIVTKLSEWIKENPELTKNIILLAGALSALLIVVGTLGLALPALTAGFALLTGPIGLVALAIAGLITITTLLITHWDEVKAYFVEAWDGIKITFKESIDKITDWIEPLLTLVNKVKSAGSTISDSFSNLKGNLFGFDGARASGGPVGAGKSYLVGEEGPEIFSPNSSGTIIPNGKTSGMSNIGGGGVNVTINGDVTGSEVIEKIKQALMLELNLNNRITI